MSAKGAQSNGRINDQNEVEIHISMPPLSLSKIEKQQEKLLGQESGKQAFMPGKSQGHQDAL
jgi:hypothetical protein